MQPVASYLVPSLMILWGVLAPATAAAQNAAPTPKDLADFEKLVLERATPDSLATDYGGAWANIYQYLVPARFIDRQLYEQVLLKLAATEGHGCDAAKERQAALACEANIAADVALSLTAFAENVLFRRDAVAFAESIADADPGRLIDTLLNLAHDEWTHGLITEAEAAVQRASAIIADRPESATYERRMRLAMLKALLADAHLDDGSALAALSEAIDAALSKGTRSAEADPRGHLSDLVTLHLRGRFCPNCGRPVAEPVKRWLTGACQNPGPVEMLQVLSAPRGTFSAAELQACARRYIKNAAKEIAAMGGQLPARADDVGKARLWALSRAIDSSFEQPKILKFLRESDPRRQAAMPMKEVFDNVVNDDFGQHGEELAIARVFEQGSWHYENGGLHNAARITLEYLIQYQKRITEQQQVVNPRTIRQARVIVLALARLATLQLAAGDRAAAARSLDDASAIAQARLREEWDGGGERAILAMRDLSDSLRLIAQTRHELIAPARLAENAAGGDALFRAMQAAITGETALTLEIAQQRRVLNTPRLAGLKREHKRAASEASRMAGLEKTYAAFNYDEALTRVRREAEARRDQAAAELGELPGPPAQTAAEIEPVTLANARSHPPGTKRWYCCAWAPTASMAFSSIATAGLWSGARLCDRMSSKPWSGRCGPAPTWWPAWPRNSRSPTRPGCTRSCSGRSRGARALIASSLCSAMDRCNRCPMASCSPACQRARQIRRRSFAPPHCRGSCGHTPLRWCRRCAASSRSVPVRTRAAPRGHSSVSETRNSRQWALASVTST
jgi:hypothetical protein